MIATACTRYSKLLVVHLRRNREAIDEQECLADRELRAEISLIALFRLTLNTNNYAS